MKAAKTPKTLKEMPYSPQKKLLKRKKTSAKTNAPISQTSSQRLKSTIQTYRVGETNNLKWRMKLGQLQEEISKASLPVIADLSNDFKSIILETD